MSVDAVQIENSTISVKRYGQSELVCAQVLGEEIRDSVRHIYADRLIHEPHEKKLGGFAVSGAISTILSIAG